MAAIVSKGSPCAISDLMKGGERLALWWWEVNATPNMNHNSKLGSAKEMKNVPSPTQQKTKGKD